VSPLYFFLSLSLSLFIAFTRVSPPPGCHPTSFLPVRPRFSTILCKFAHRNFFPSGVTPLEGVTRGGPPPTLVTPLAAQCSTGRVGAIALFNTAFSVLCDNSIINSLLQCTLPKITFVGLHFCRRQYGSIFNYFDVTAPKANDFGEIKQNNGHYAVQGHSRTPLSVSMESPYATSY